LDNLSEGRVNWGSGKSSSLVEQLAFENDVPMLHDQWLEAVEMIPKMWSSDVFSFKGRFFNIPPTQIIPKPVQQPHPPMFAAWSKPDTAAAMGHLGLGALNFAFGSDDYLTQKVDEYRKAVAAAQPVGRAKNNHFACTPATLVLEDDRKACAYGLRGARFFLESLHTYYLGRDRPVGELSVSRDFLPDAALEEAMRQRNAAGSQVANIVGDPVCARETVQRFVDIGVDELILMIAMVTLQHELIIDSTRTFAEKVMPHFS